MTKLSVNINKIATLRNARGGNLPDVVKVALDCERFGAQGITVHPRPDERHIRFDDVRRLKPLLKTEFNIEGYPSENFIELVLSVHPHQVTLVPDPPDALTSNSGWDTIDYKDFLIPIIKQFKDKGIRTSIFIDPVVELINYAADIGTDRVELYTEAYAKNYSLNREIAIEDYLLGAEAAVRAGMGVNAGHDLNLDNLYYFSRNVPCLLEVSIGHALICDSLYLGLEKTIIAYLQELKK